MDNQKLQTALKQASPYLNKVGSKEDALNALASAGIPTSFIDTALGMIDSPKAQKLTGLASLAGIDINSAKQNLSSLKTQAPYNVSTAKPTAIDPLADLKSSLKRKI